MKSIIALLLLPPGAASLSFQHKGYTGLFNCDGQMVTRQEFKNYESHELHSQLDHQITMPWIEYMKKGYGQQPKWLYHCTTKGNAEKIAKSRAIYGSDDSNGDARLGDGVYMTAMPADWATPEVVKANNWGQKNARKFENWHKVNAYVRVRFDALWDADWVDIVYKEDWQSNFCIQTPRGELYLTKELDAQVWFQPGDRTTEETPELFWSAKGGYTPFSKMKKRKYRLRRD